MSYLLVLFKKKLLLLIYGMIKKNFALVIYDMNCQDITHMIKSLGGQEGQGFMKVRVLVGINL